MDVYYPVLNISNLESDTCKGKLKPPSGIEVQNYLLKIFQKHPCDWLHFYWNKWKLNRIFLCGIQRKE